MIRTIALITALTVALAAGAADAKSCKDPKTGKFIKCPVPAAAPKHCRDAKGKFIKCPA
jgi:hypothetical protein